MLRQRLCVSIDGGISRVHWFCWLISIKVRSVLLFLVRSIVLCGCSLGRDISVLRPPRDVLTSCLGQSAHCLGLFSLSDLCIFCLDSVLSQKVLAYHLGSWTISSHRDISCRCTVHNFFKKAVLSQGDHLKTKKTCTIFSNSKFVISTDNWFPEKIKLIKLLSCKQVYKVVIQHKWL